MRKLSASGSEFDVESATSSKDMIRKFTWRALFGGCSCELAYVWQNWVVNILVKNCFVLSVGAKNEMRGGM